jgi:DNA modification methylase
MDGKKASLFHTDPPFVVEYTGKRIPNTSGKDWSGTYHEIDIKDAKKFFRNTFLNAINYLEDNAAWYCWHGNKREYLIHQIWEELGILNHQQIIWVKPSAMHSFVFYPWRHEPCLMGWKKGNKPNHDGDNSHTHTSVWEIDWEGKRRSVGNEHPTQKPIKIFAIPMKKHTQKGAICYEPFCGSGSQVIAAEQLERRCYAMEIEPYYCSVIIDRWETLTGQRAVLIE